MSIKNLLISFGLILVVSTALAWLGSNPAIRIVYPDATDDADTCLVPVNVKVKQLNTLQGIDYGLYWLVEEIDGDTVISDTEWNARVQIPVSNIEDINREAPLVIAELGTNFLIQSTYYYIIGIGKDLNGDYSADSSLIPGVSQDGDANIADSAIARFYVNGYR